MYNMDKPIENFKDDILGRSFFAKQLGQSILAIDSKDTITIGLYGKWGSGKTSIINLALKEIEDKVSSLKEAHRPLIMRFAPWNFTDNQNLILQFFKQLKSELKIKNYVGFSKGLGEALDSYSGAIELAQAVPVIGQYIPILKMTMNFLSKRLKGNASDDGIVSTKNKVIEELKKNDKKIVIVIDDIDRLSNEQIRMVFQLVKEVASLPNIIYLLSMDKDIVVRALTQVQECDGEEYLEKIVQVPFLIPKLDRNKVLNLLFVKLDEIINKKEVNIDKEYWSKVYWKCIYPYVNTIRDVNRIINTFQFRYYLVAEEVNFIDMITITVIQVMKPKIYNWILENEGKICGGSAGYGGVVYNEQDNKKKLYTEELHDIGGAEALEVISALFPKIDREINHNYELVSDDVLRKNLRIADSERFKVYFSLDISDIAVSHNTLIRSINEMQENELQELLYQLNNSNKIIPYLRELKGYSDEVPINRIYLLIEILYKNMQSFVGEEWKSIISFSAQRYAEWCIDSLLKRIGSNDERYNIFTQIIENADLKTLNSMAEDINRIELGYGRLAGKSEKKEEQIIKIEQLKELEKVYVSRINYLLGEQQSLFECNKLFLIVYLWKNFDKESCKKYINSLLNNPVNVLKFIVRMSSEWIGTEGRGWSFSEDNYSEFVSKDRITEVINSYFKGNIKEEFSQEEEAKMASFILMDKNTYQDNISEKEALEYVQQYKL